MRITDWRTGNTIYQDDCETMQETVATAVKKKINLSGSDLSDSNLSGSDLSYSNLRGSNLSYSNLSDSNLSIAVCRVDFGG